MSTPTTEGNEASQLAAIGIAECGAQSSQAGNSGDLQPGAEVPPFVSYNRDAAKNWALAHAEDTPPDAGSCTWFVSQALRAGGFPETDAWNLGFIGIERNLTVRDGIDTTRKTPDFFAYMKTLPYVKVEYLGQMKDGVNDVPDARPGDVIIYDWEGDGSVDHADVVVGHAADNSQYPLVSGWSENGSGRVYYPYRGWTWSEEHGRWLQSEPHNQNMQAWLVHVVDEDSLNITAGN